MTRSAISHSFSLRKAAKLCGIPPSRLHYWTSTGLIRPSGKGAHDSTRTQASGTLYTFGDILGIRVAKRLTDQGASLAQIRDTVSALRRLYPRVSNPLVECSVERREGRVVVEHESRLLEVQTGQYVLDFRDPGCGDVHVLSSRSHAGATASARALYLRGCELEQNPDLQEEALQAYQNSVLLDDAYAPAWVNLGNLWYRGSEHSQAQECYERALQIDPAQPEALYNLGMLMYENGRLHEAVTSWERLIAHHPEFAEGHFMLALAREETGDKPHATTHWERFLTLSPASPWAEVAKHHLL
jgi:tetratricopeptide (TPR) repeat protein